MLKIEKKFYEIEIDGVLYKVSAPTVLQIKKYSQVNEKESFDVFVELVEELGIPKNVLMSLDIESIEKISELLFPKKKN